MSLRETIQNCEYCVLAHKAVRCGIGEMVVKNSDTENIKRFTGMNNKCLQLLWDMVKIIKI